MTGETMGDDFEAARLTVRLDAIAGRPGEVWIGFGPDCAGSALSLSEAGDPVEGGRGGD